MGLDWVGLSRIFALGNVPGKLALLGADSQAAYDGYYETQRGLMNSIGVDLAQVGLGGYGMAALPRLGFGVARALGGIAAGKDIALGLSSTAHTCAWASASFCPEGWCPYLDRVGSCRARQ